MSKIDSIKALIKKRAISENRTFQEMLTLYGLERALYRLSISSYAKSFILKGGILLYAMYKGQFIRGTSDIDFLSNDLNHDLERIKDVFAEIFNIDYLDDGITFDLSTLTASRIAEFKKYPGVTIQIHGFLDRTKLLVRMDVGFGDTIYPDSIHMTYPTLLDFDPPMIYAYSKESIIAEKFEAIVSLGNANSRMKDFFDIYSLLKTYDFKGELLKESINETFKNRQTSFDVIKAFEPAFLKDDYRLKMWKGFIKGKNVEPFVEFENVVIEIQHFLSPLIQSLLEKTNFNKVWNYQNGKWNVF